jgi:hypothetical protein
VHTTATAEVQIVKQSLVIVVEEELGGKKMNDIQ